MKRNETEIRHRRAEILRAAVLYEEKNGFGWRYDHVETKPAELGSMCYHGLIKHSSGTSRRRYEVTDKGLEFLLEFEEDDDL